MRLLSTAFFGAATLAAGTVSAEELRPLCADRPGNGTPACTVDAGHFQAEVGLLDFQRDDNASARTDTYSAAAMELRFGLTDSVEAQLQWAPWVTVHTRDKASGDTSTLRGSGDLTLAARKAFKAGDSVTWALQPFVTAPTGSNGIGDDAWQGGLVVPVAVALTPQIDLSMTGEVDVVPDADSHGRHLAYAGVVGLNRGVGDVTLTGELAGSIDDDAHSRQATADLAASWIPAAQPSAQFDIGLNLGLNRQTPDSELYVGVVRRF